MDFSYEIYVVTDTHGNKTAGVVEEGCDCIQICGMKDAENNSVYFESDAHHLHTWCRDNGFTLNVIKKIERV